MRFNSRVVSFDRLIWEGGEHTSQLVSPLTFGAGTDEHVNDATMTDNKTDGTLSHPYLAYVGACRLILVTSKGHRGARVLHALHLQ